MHLIFFLVFLIGFDPESVRIKYEDRDKFWLIDHNLYHIIDGRILVRNLESNQNYIIKLKNKILTLEIHNQVIDKGFIF